MNEHASRNGNCLEGNVTSTGGNEENIQSPRQNICSAKQTAVFNRL